jgi:hypothetical protein
VECIRAIRGEPGIRPEEVSSEHARITVVTSLLCDLVLVDQEQAADLVRARRHSVGDESAERVDFERRGAHLVSSFSVARESRTTAAVESEDAMQRGDEALNAMNPGGVEPRVSVEFFEVPVQTVT